MKARPLSTIGLIALIIGVIMVICFKSITTEGITIAAGIVFVAIGVINFIFPEKKTDGGVTKATTKFLNIMAYSAALVLGISMLVFVKTFMPLIAFIFGLIVAICSAWQFYVVLAGDKNVKLPQWFIAFPILIAIAAVFIFVQDSGEGDSRIVMATGIALILMGIGAILESAMYASGRRHLEKMQRTSDKPRITEGSDEKKTTENLDDE